MPHPNVAAHRRLGSDGAGAVGSMPSTVTARHPRKPGALDDPLFWRPGVAGAGGSSTVAPGQCLVANTSGRVACSRRHSTVVAQNPRWSSVERSRGEAVDRCPRPFANLEGIKSLGGRSRESRDPSPSLTQRSHSWASLREPQAPHAVRHAASVVRPHSSSPKRPVSTERPMLSARGHSPRMHVLPIAHNVVRVPAPQVSVPSDLRGGAPSPPTAVVEPHAAVGDPFPIVASSEVQDAKVGSWVPSVDVPIRAATGEGKMLVNAGKILDEWPSLESQRIIHEVFDGINSKRSCQTTTSWTNQEVRRFALRVLAAHGLRGEPWSSSTFDEIYESCGQPETIAGAELLARRFLEHFYVCLKR